MIDQNSWVNEQTDFDSVVEKWQSIVNLMSSIYKATAGFIVQHTSKGFQISIASQQPENPYGIEGVIPFDTNIFCKKIVETGSPLYVKQATNMPEWDTNPEVSDDNFNSYLGVPILWPDGQIFGTICVMDFDVTDYDANYLELIQHFRDLVQSDLQLMHQYELIKALAINDELTNQYNRRGFMTLAENRLMLAKRKEETLALLFIDINDMKLINDEYGHNAGDEAITLVANAIQKSTRESDICARIGGDEYLVLTNTKSQELNSIQTRINDQLKRPRENTTFHVTVSYGMVEINDYDLELKDWIEQADIAMYKNKKIGS